MYIDKDDLITHFFRVFEIEPKRNCYWSNTHCKNCNEDCVNFYIKPKYPEISDRKLLEMICIYNSTYTNGYTNYSLLNERNVEKLKEQILKNCLIVRDDIKHQIQQLFEEGK